jgi:hypothetical protein
MFVTFPTSDFALAQQIYGAAGFVTLATIPGPDGAPSLIHLRREQYQDILLVPRNSETPQGYRVSIAAKGVDFNVIAAKLKALKVDLSGPSDTPWFTTDLSFTDLDGNTVTLTSPRASEYQEAAEWVDKHISGNFETGAEPRISSTITVDERKRAE